MAYPGVLDLQALAKLNGVDLAADGAAVLGARALDADGDGRPDLYLVDTDGDGAANGVVRAVDTNGDGVNDTFIQYDEKGTVGSIGRVDPATGELEVAYEEPDAIDEMLGSLGLADLESPEEALYTSFGDPYIAETYGSFGDEVPETTAAAGEGAEPPVVEDLKVTEVDEGAAAGPGSDEEAAGAAEPPEVVPRIVEIEDRSGGQRLEPLGQGRRGRRRAGGLRCPSRKDEHGHLLRRHRQGRLFRGRRHRPRRGQPHRYGRHDRPGLVGRYGGRGPGRRSGRRPPRGSRGGRRRRACFGVRRRVR
jgi:hypothetical protein